MTQQMTTVATEDLRVALVYLEGLVDVAQRLAAADGIGRALANALARSLLELDTEDPIYFDPLRYESDIPGTGWNAIAIGTGELRDRLLERYGNDAD